MKVLLIAATFLVCLVVTNEKSVHPTKPKWSIGDTQTNPIGFQIDDKSTIIRLSNAVDTATSNVVKIIEDSSAEYADDLRNLTHPLKDVVLLIWSTPEDDLFQDNLYFLFDKMIDILYCAREALDDVWRGATYTIESKLTQISQHILGIIDDVKSLSESENKDEFDITLSLVNETLVELTVSIVGLTALITSLIKLIAMNDKTIFLIIGSIGSLLIIHQYTLSSVACLLSRAIEMINSLNTVSDAGIANVESTIITYILDLKEIVLNTFPDATMTEWFNGNLLSMLSKKLLKSIDGLIGDKMLRTIRTSTTSLFNIIQEYATTTFHILPDLLDQLAAVLFRLRHIKFHKLELFITYAFDGLFDVLHHISYDLDQNIKSSASTGSFQEPSEPIEMAVINIATNVKYCIREAQNINGSATYTSVDLITSLKNLVQSVLDPMHTIIHKYSDDDSITLVSSLQFIMLYVIGLIETPLLAKDSHNIKVVKGIDLNFSAIISLALVKIQLIFDYWHIKNTMTILKKINKVIEELLQDLSGLDEAKDAIGETKHVDLYFH